MTLNDYSTQAGEFAIYPGRASGLTYATDGRNPTFHQDWILSNTYVIMKLAAEAGEVAQKFAKYLRGDHGNTVAADVRLSNEILMELGDVLWYVQEIAQLHGSDMETVAKLNLNKLRSRRDRGQIRGSGDNR